MWVFEEEVEGRKLTDWINNNHENRKYLPGFELPSNLRAVPSLTDACRDADLLVFVMPHQFIEVTSHCSLQRESQRYDTGVLVQEFQLIKLMCLPLVSADLARSAG